MLNMSFSIVIALALLISSSSTNGIEFDYCVADPTLPHGPFGYPCKDPSKVTTDDFSYSGLRKPGNTSNAFKFGPNPAFVTQFPGLNGMDISMVRADIDVGGAVPIHTHRVAELAILIKGTILAGFIDTNNTAFYNTMEEGDMFIFPPTLAHFQVNVGKVPAVAYAAFPSTNPGFQGISSSLFKNDLSAEIIQKITLLDPVQIKKLKAGFGGTN
ncbi:auxin-binding protein ABP20-like [Silene latifolia]|uniref:auxin-binding protein ABP20-like n=1 Tax=Silene latifolia TaxID=37657 RepID=UPI003D78593B